MFDPNAEYRLLGALVDHPDVIYSISEHLFTEHRIALFRAMRDAFTYYGVLTHESIERYYQNPIPGEVEAGRGSKPEPLIDRLQVMQKKRQLADISNRITLLLSQPDPALNDIQKALQFELEGSGLDSSIAPGLSEFIGDFNRKRTGLYKFVRTGLRVLDYMLGGEWGRKALTMVLAKPGGGKTGLVCTSMLNMARQGQPVLFISIEMPKDRVISRLVSGMAEINNRDIRAGAVEHTEAIDAALEELHALPIYIVHKTDITLAEILNQIRIHKELYNIDAFFVDYLQIISRDESRDVDELGRITKALRDAAEKYDIAGIVLAQLNYEGNIFGSSKVQWIADNVIQLDAREDDKNNDDLRLLDVTALKNREGPLGSQVVRFIPKFVRFID